MKTKIIKTNMKTVITESDKKELQSAQMFINKNADLLIKMLPEGSTEGGMATGIPKTLLNIIEIIDGLDLFNECLIVSFNNIHAQTLQTDNSSLNGNEFKFPPLEVVIDSVSFCSN